MARFLIDESLPRIIGRRLTVAGHDVLDVRDAGLRGATDTVIANRAAGDLRIVVAGDADFANALRFPPGSHPGMVVLRLPSSWSPFERADRLIAALDSTVLVGMANAIVIIEPSRVRILSAPSAP